MLPLLKKLLWWQQEPPPPPPQPPVPFLSDDLTAEILSYLPVKSLVRFKCVCKSWNSLLSDPNFIKLHLHRSPRNPNLLLSLAEPFPRSLDKIQDNVVSCTVRSFMSNPKSTIAAREGCYSMESGYIVDGSCNGLVCLLGGVQNALENEANRYFFRLWNPAMRFCSNISPRIYVKDPEKSRFGFGYDDSSDTYKVVAVLCDRKATEDSKRTEVRVYRFGDDCWRSAASVPFVLDHRGQFVCGTLNWVSIGSMSGKYVWKNVAIEQLVIVSIDMATETHKQFSLPSAIDEVPQFHPTLGVLSGTLCLFHDYKGTHFVLWQMKEFGVENSWTQLVKLSYEDLQIEDVSWYGVHVQYDAPQPLCISEDGDFLMLGKCDSREIVLCDRRDNRLERTRISNFSIFAFDYRESLITVG